MNVGDRVMYRNEPAYVVGFYRNQHHGWVLVERADGSKRFVRPAELHLLEKAPK